MIRNTLNRLLETLKEDVLVLESLARQAMLGSVSALVKRDYETSRRIYTSDHIINDKRYQLETNCIAAIATQQPMAGDLRILASILEISTELERIGDYAKGIARITFMLEDKELLEPIQELPAMTAIAADMLQRSVRAFVNRDVDEARAIPALDDEVDNYHNRISSGLVGCVTERAELAETANHLQWAVHNVERMADRVTNICERTIYVVTGQMHEIESNDHEIRMRGQVMEQKLADRQKVLFLCTGNSCRSQMAEAIVNARMSDRWQAYSAGVQPAGYVHPLAIKALAEIGIQHEGSSKTPDALREIPFDLVVTVCEPAAESCPVWLRGGKVVHFPLEDPAKAEGSAEEVMGVFRRVRDEIASQIPDVLDS